MKKSLSLSIVALAMIGTAARADMISGSTTGSGNSITGPDITASNSGTVTATGTFSARSFILGGRSNNIGVSAAGVAVLVSITHAGGDPDASGSDSIVIGNITATNSGTITATGTFNGTTLRGGNGNSATVSAAGTSVTIAITHR